MEGVFLTVRREGPHSGAWISYRLVNIFDAGGLWARRANAETFASFGAFRGDDGQDNAANAPRGWDDHDDGGDLLGGESPPTRPS